MVEVPPRTIPGMSWEHMQHLSNKVRNVLRRGYLLKTYNDGKILRGRVKMGDKMENDKIDFVNPIGYVSHVKASEKTEVFTMDVGADASRRVCVMVIGDREQHPQPDENEQFIYAPGDKAEDGVPKQFLRHKKKSDNGGGGGSGGGRMAGSAGDGQTKDSGRVTGMHWDSGETKVSGQNKETFQNKATKGMGHATDANFDIKAANATQFEAGKHVRKGTTYRDGDTYTQGTEHATDHIAGGGASVGSLPTRSLAEYLRMPGGGKGLPENTPDGSQNMSASGQPGNISLKGMAAAMGMASVSSSGEGPPTGGGMKAEMAQMQQQQQQQQGKNDELLRRIIRIEDHLGIGPPP